MNELKKYLIIVESPFFMMFIPCERTGSLNNPFDLNGDVLPECTYFKFIGL